MKHTAEIAIPTNENDSLAGSDENSEISSI
jgi:hypothetical protein